MAGREGTRVLRPRLRKNDADLMAALGIAEFATRPLSSCTLATQQRTEIARALAINLRARKYDADVAAKADGAVQHGVSSWLPCYEIPAGRNVEEHHVDERRRDAGRVAVDAGDFRGEVRPGGFVEQAFGAEALVDGHA